MGKDDVYVVEGFFKRATPKAICIAVGDDGVWIPKSMILQSNIEIDDFDPEDVAQIQIPMWLAREKELSD
jgi:hypothetical protein